MKLQRYYIDWTWNGENMPETRVVQDDNGDICKSEDVEKLEQLNYKTLVLLEKIKHESYLPDKIFNEIEVIFKEAEAMKY